MSLLPSLRLVLSTAGVQPLSGAYELSAVDAVTGAVVSTFIVAPRLQIHYSPIGGAIPSIFFVGDAAPQEIASTVDQTTHTVTADLPHFSLYVAGATLPGGSPYYSFDVIARTGDTLSWLDSSGTTVTRSIISFGTGPSINSSGAVAFTRASPAPASATSRCSWRTPTARSRTSGSG